MKGIFELDCFGLDDFDLVVNELIFTGIGVTRDRGLEIRSVCFGLVILHLVIDGVERNVEKVFEVEKEELSGVLFELFM